MSRLTAEFWVSAYLAQLRGEGVFAHLIHKGDAQAGAIAVKLALMDGRASLFTRAYLNCGRLGWIALIEEAPEREVDEAIARRRRGDRDLWVVEVEDARGRHLLDRMDAQEWPGQED